MNKKTLLSFVAALFVVNTAMTAVEPVNSIKTQTSKDCLSQIFTKRYSGYAYDTSRIVTAEQLRSIVEAGHSAPSSYNEQPWRFIICDRTTDPAAYDKAFSTLVEFNQGWAKNAPVLIVSVAASKSAHSGEPNRWSQYDTGAAAFGMMLQATELGLMAHQMGGFDEAKMQQVFSIPADFVPMSVMAIGYADINELPKARQRKPLEENFFKGSWGKGFN